MSFSYSGNPQASDLDMVRFLLADTSDMDPYITDEEINAFLLTNPNVQNTVLKCLQFIMTKLSRECDYTIGPEKVSASQRYEQTKQLYNSLKAEYTVVNICPQQENLRPIFNIGFMDNGRD